MSLHPEWWYVCNVHTKLDLNLKMGCARPFPVISLYALVAGGVKESSSKDVRYDIVLSPTHHASRGLTQQN